MTTWIVPMFIVVEADTVEQAENKAGEAQTAAYRVGLPLVYQDEGIQIKEVPSDDEYHSILDYYTTEELIR